MDTENRTSRKRNAFATALLTTLAFALGFAEFVMMGILPATATGLRVSVPDAGDFISAYALGVCAGTLFLVFGRRAPTASR